jgi:hypothetical protein
MAHMYGYADPNVYRNELSRMTNSTTGTSGNHTTGTGPGTGYMRAEDGYGHGDGVGGGVDGGAGGYGTHNGYDTGYGRSGVQGFEQQQPPMNRNTQMGPDTDGMGGLSPNRGPQNVGSEAGWTSMSQAGTLTPTQQRIKRDFPPELPPRSQAQPADNDQRGQMYQ